MKIAINGFGRIGRQAYKIARDKGLEVVAINDLTRADELAHLLKFDSVYGTYGPEVKAYIGDEEFIAGTESLLDVTPDYVAQNDSTLVVDGQETKVFSIKNPAELPWGELGVDVVIECTGIFVKNDDARGHLKAGAKKVVLSAPSKGDNPAPTYVLGANDEKYEATQDLISNASCTTNCISPVTKVMMDNFGIQKAVMTTTHAYTSTQNLIDGLHKDLRRGRAAALNMIPTSTGAAIATTKALPSLAGKFDGGAIRVPVPAGSVSDLVYLTEKKVTAEEVAQAFRDAAAGEYKGILAASDAPLVSSDIVGRPESAIVDLPMIKVVDGDLVKVLAWYDNEWGYSNRLIEMVIKVGS